MKKKNSAFTLAEVLITLGIIGVVAAMTMPTLIAKYKERETVTKLKKFYSIMSQAFLSATNEYGTPDTWANVSTSIAGNSNSIIASKALFIKFKPFLKISKDCAYDYGCFPDVRYKFLNGTSSLNFVTNNYKRHMIKLSDGSTAAFLSSFAGPPNNFYGAIYYDVNGDKGPNQFGVDLFQFDILKNGIIPSNANVQNSILSNCIDYGFYCSSWVLVYENMDYLHCPNKLDWNTKTSCK